LDRYAVIGNPIEHSKSPWIHARFAEQTQQSLEYRALLVELDAFERSVTEFFDKGGKGLNITVPFKTRAWAMAERHSEAARKAGAVNTLYRDSDGALIGENTDGTGLLRDLKQNHGAVLAEKRILLLGAGGAVKGVLANLIAESPSAIYIANRTVENAQALANAVQSEVEIHAVRYDDIPTEAFDFIINGTSAGLQGDLPKVHSGAVSTHTWCYDMIYGVGDTKFQTWAKSLQAAHAHDGLGMLVEQAAESFRIWRGLSPQTAPVIRQLRQLLAQV
tara:strand:+ start:503 stop:1330 length:828 start_codon:yes stop_codon:yes gene_type:complete